jgi:hypothetical protein
MTSAQLPTTKTNSSVSEFRVDRHLNEEATYRPSGFGSLNGSGHFMTPPQYHLGHLKQFSINIELIARSRYRTLALVYTDRLAFRFCNFSITIHT